jgi:ribosomal protein S18 acetylase RimI-like enzyme
MDEEVISTGTSIRPATRNDAEVVAYLMYLAGRGHVSTSVMDLLVPGPYGPTPERLGRLADLFGARASSMFHHSLYRVVEVEGRVASCACTYSKEQVGYRGMVEAMRENGWRDDEMAAMGERMESFLTVNPGAPSGTVVIENVATLEPYRRMGLVRGLLLEAIAGRAGRPVQISCFIGNLPAQRAYESVGFEVTESRRDPAFEEVFSCPGMNRLTLGVSGRGS